MTELIYNSYAEYKKEFDSELRRVADSFVRIGYLLKLARDTDILKGSIYRDVNHFAKKEYGLDKTQVSRFISINDEFAEGGYSDKLKEQYRGFGYSKLTIMLSLPDSINEELSANYSKSEIQAIKDEIEEEAKTSDIDLYMERIEEEDKGKYAAAAVPEDNNASKDKQEGNIEEPHKLIVEADMSILDRLIIELGKEDAELRSSMRYLAKASSDKESGIKEIMCPDREKTYSIRLKGEGRYIIMLDEKKDYVSSISLRSQIKAQFSWQEMIEAWEKFFILHKDDIISADEKKEELASNGNNGSRNYDDKKAAADKPKSKLKSSKERKVKKAVVEKPESQVRAAVTKIEDSKPVDKLEPATTSVYKEVGYAQVEDMHKPAEVMPGPSEDMKTIEARILSTLEDITNAVLSGDYDKALSGIDLIRADINSLGVARSFADMESL